MKRTIKIKTSHCVLGTGSLFCLIDIRKVNAICYFFLIKHLASYFKEHNIIIFRKFIIGLPNILRFIFRFKNIPIML